MKRLQKRNTLKTSVKNAENWATTVVFIRTDALAVDMVILSEDEGINRIFSYLRIIKMIVSVGCFSGGLIGL